MNINTLKQYAVARTFFTPTSLESAVTQLGFVQIDPICAPACAQDLMLRHRVADYAKGGLDCAYPSSALEEVYFINHGVMPRAQALSLWSRKPLTDFLHNHADAIQMVQDLLNTTPELDSRSLNQKLGNQLVTNGWGAQGQAGTQLLQRMHSAGGCGFGCDGCAGIYNVCHNLCALLARLFNLYGAAARRCPP
jgi:uncharacterized protein YcaQ